jgi:hypothetical protein
VYEVVEDVVPKAAETIDSIGLPETEIYKDVRRLRVTHHKNS